MLDNPRSPRVRAVAKLTKRSARQETGLFLLEGPQAAREALAYRPDTVVEVYATPTAMERHPDVRDAVREAGLPFRDAHHATGALVAAAEARGVDLPDLSLAEMQAVNPAITDAVYDVLGVHNSVASRISYGGTAPDQVRAQVKRWQEIMGEWA